MFGAAFLFFIIIYAVITYIRNVKHDLQNRKDYRNPRTNTYLSFDGSFRDLDSGKHRNFRQDKYGDLYMRGEDIDEINLSQKERELKYEELRNDRPQNITACFYSNQPKGIKYGSKIKKGCRYKDLSTGELYVVRKNKIRQSFYVTFDNRVVRFTDRYRNNQINKGIYDKKKEEKAIRDFQTMIDSVLDDDFWKNDPTLIECRDFGGKND